jgi:Xaa-Pro dipeptidase
MNNEGTKLTFGQGAVDWQERINVARIRKARADRAREVLRKHDIAAILAAGSPDTRYLTGLIGSEFERQLWYVLFFAEHDPVVFASPGWLNQMPQEAPWISNWRGAHAWLGNICGVEASRAEAKLFAAGVYEELKKRGLAGEKLAIAGVDNLSGEFLRDAGAAVVNGSPLMLEMRSIKSEDEINCLKTIATIVEAGWHKVWQELRPGMRDTELCLIAIEACYKAGAHFVPSFGVRSGPASFYRGYSNTGRLIQTGDLIFMSMCGAKFMGYNSCTYRTLIAGRRPNQEEQDAYKRLLDRMDAVIGEIRPGATTADAAKHFKPAENWGHEDESQVLTIDIGHGIGLAGYEPPVINRQWSLDYPQVFQPGMTIAVESLEQLPSRAGGVRLENMIVVTEKGAEIIDHMPRERILEPMMLWG